MQTILLTDCFVNAIIKLRKFLELDVSTWWKKVRNSSRQHRKIANWSIEQFITDWLTEQFIADQLTEQFTVNWSTEKFIANRLTEQFIAFFLFFSSLNACSLWLWHCLDAVCMLSYM